MVTLYLKLAKLLDIFYGFLFLSFINGEIIMLRKFKFNNDLNEIFRKCKGVYIPKQRNELIDLSLGSETNDTNTISYLVNGKIYIEATVVRCKNGVSVNFTDDYMRRRDPNCLIVADDKPTDKPHYENVYNKNFSDLRNETFNWLSEQDLLIVPFMSGGKEYGYETVLITPRNAAFFACSLAGLQYFVNIDEYEGIFEPKSIIYLAPPFRHTHFNGKQMVIHNRLDEVYEMFAYNLYPGPSAKKGVYGFLIDIGEREGWVTAHASAVKITTPYDIELVIMHEGASGGGKSEMGEHIHRERDGRIIIGKHLITGEEFDLGLMETCQLELIADDMALCHKKLQNDSGKLVIIDGEDGWFLRMDHIKGYGTEPYHEKTCIHPKEPLVFLNMQGQPHSTCLIWEHTLDSTGKPCPNPRVVMPRRLLPNIINTPVEVDVRSFGVRTPPSSLETPGFGILGMIQVLPPALAWLWRLVAPRGHKNPSIDANIGTGLESEGVGSYWPFATGKRVNQANLLLKQILDTPNTKYLLIPNQHIGIYKVGFAPQWIAREFIARRGGATFLAKHLTPARLTLLGFCLDDLKINGQHIRSIFLKPEMQPELGIDGYDVGAKMLIEFFKKELLTYELDRIEPIGQQIIECCLADGTMEDYISLMPIKF